MVENIVRKGHLLTPLGNKPFENTVGKGEDARNKQFLLFPQCFLPIWITSCHFVKFEIVVCKLFQFGRVQNLSSGNGLRKHHRNYPEMTLLRNTLKTQVAMATKLKNIENL